MALIIGTNCGFVTTAPTSDPTEASLSFDDANIAGKFTTPSGGNILITEIGWYKTQGSQTGDFDVGIYTDESANPDVIVGSITFDTAASVGLGWKKVSALNITLSPSTNYWIATSFTDTSSPTGCSSNSSSGSGAVRSLFTNPNLEDPWIGTSFSDADRLLGIYALYEDAPVTETLRLIKISGTFQDKPILIKVAGTFVDKPIKIKVGGTFQDA